MIHKFTMDGINIVTDVNSGAVHIVSDLVYKLIDSTEAEKRSFRHIRNRKYPRRRQKLNSLKTTDFFIRRILMPRLQKDKAPSGYKGALPARFP